MLTSYEHDEAGDKVVRRIGRRRRRRRRTVEVTEEYYCYYLLTAQRSLSAEH